MSSSRKGVAVGVLEDTRYHVIATPINKNTEKMIIIFLRESHPIITARITTLQKDAKPLLSFFYWNIVWWMRCRKWPPIFWSKSRTGEYIFCLKRTFVKNFSFKHCWFTHTNLRLFFSANIFIAQNLNRPRCTIWWISYNSIFANLQNTEGQNSFFRKWHHAHHILAKFAIMWLKILKLFFSPMYRTCCIQEYSTNTWSQYQKKTNHAGMKSIASICFWKNKISCCQSKNHPNSP